jgi:LPPG:FO 2-phospho-L-lactate transferase
MITMLGGGIGASRLWTGLREAAVDRMPLTAVVNTADDVWLHGLRICPDVDTLLYGLSGVRDEDRGWGIAGDTFRCMAQLRRLGGDAWFSLGDIDLAVHLLRTGRLLEGATLTTVTRELAERLGVGVRVLPMTDDEVHTRVSTPSGPLHYQEYFVREECRPPVTAVEHVGLVSARPAPGVLEAISTADLVVLGPSNPVASISPILGLRGVREALHARTGPVVAVTPVISNIPITEDGEQRRAASRAALLAARGLAHRASAVAGLYRDVIDAFVLDVADGDQHGEVAALGLHVIIADTLIRDPERSVGLADRLLELISAPRRPLNPLAEG